MKQERVIAKQLLEKANENWGELQKQFYLCYSVGELASDTIYKLFDKDIWNDIASYYRVINERFKILCELEENVYFQFDIYWETGFLGDCGLHIDNGKFKLMNKVPKGWKDIWELLEDDEEE